MITVIHEPLPGSSFTKAVPLTIEKTLLFLMKKMLEERAVPANHDLPSRCFAQASMKSSGNSSYLVTPSSGIWYQRGAFFRCRCMQTSGMVSAPPSRRPSGYVCLVGIEVILDSHARSAFWAESPGGHARITIANRRSPTRHLACPRDCGLGDADPWSEWCS